MDYLRPMFCRLFVAAILGSLWFYADLERRISLGQNYRLPALSQATDTGTSAGVRPAPMLPLFGPATQPSATAQLGLADE